MSESKRKNAGNPAKEIVAANAKAAATERKVASAQENATTEEKFAPAVVAEETAETTVETEETAEITEETAETTAETEETAKTTEETAETTAETEETAKITEETAETIAETTEENTAEKPAEKPADDGFKKAVVAGGLVGLVLLLSTFIVLLCLLLRGENTQPPVENPGETTVSTSESTQKVEDTTSSTSESTQKVEDTSSTSDTTQKVEDTSSSTSDTTQKPEEPAPAFDIKAFEKKAVRLAETYGSTNAAADVSKLTSLLGTEKIASLVAEYGETKTAKELATLVTFAPKAIGKAYADEIGSNWISTEDFFEEQFEKSDEFKAVTGKNPETVMMSLKDPDNPEYSYETFKGNTQALLSLAKKTLSVNEYQLFEEWLIMRNSGFALANKVEKHIVSKKETLLTSEGTLEFFELQMKMVEGGMVTTTAGNQASAEYVEFVQTNFYIITAGA